MSNPLVHAIVLVLAILIPGGLLLYFGWRACVKGGKNVKRATPEELREAFFNKYPKNSKRKESKLRQLQRVRSTKRRSSKESQ